LQRINPQTKAQKEIFPLATYFSLVFILILSFRKYYVNRNKELLLKIKGDKKMDSVETVLSIVLILGLLIAFSKNTKRGDNNG
jgi:hypothetical protein